jgi:hypothetical protein
LLFIFVEVAIWRESIYCVGEKTMMSNKKDDSKSKKKRKRKSVASYHFNNDINQDITRKEERKDIFLSVCFATCLLVIIVSVSFHEQKDYFLAFPLILSSPIVIYEMFQWIKDIYKSRFGKYEQTVQKAVTFMTDKQLLKHSENSRIEIARKSRALLLFIRILYSFTFITFTVMIMFFTYETFERSYYGTKSMHDVKNNVVQELQQHILHRFCCPRTNHTSYELKEYSRTQIISVLRHYHIRDLFFYNRSVNLLDNVRDCDERILRNKNQAEDCKFYATVDQLVNRTLDVLEHNTGFKFHFELDIWEWMFDFKPVDVLKVKLLFYILYSMYFANYHFARLVSSY